MKYMTNGARHSYYKRLTFDKPFNAYSNFAVTWASPDNLLSVDFEIYGNYSDLHQGTHPWEYCNYDDHDIAYPRDCGPSGPVGCTWTSLTRIHECGIGTAEFWLQVRMVGRWVGWVGEEEEG